MTRQSTRIAMFGGLDGRAYRDESSQVLAMRGGYNVELVDNEWWTRAGERQVASNNHTPVNLPWWWLVDYSRASGFGLLVSPGYALFVRTADGGMRNAYSPRATESISRTAGSATVTLPANSTAVAGDLLLEGGGWSLEAYCLVARSGTVGTIDRNAASTGSASFRVIAPLVASPLASVGAWYSDRGRGGVAIFEQLVTNATYNLLAGHSYLVITSEYGPPVAIDIGVNAALPLVVGWFHGENVTTVDGATLLFPSAPGGEVCATVGNRLIVGRALDPTGDTETKANTFYFSQIGDISRWSTGSSQGIRTHNYVTLNDPDDEIQNIVALDTGAAVYRKKSRVLVTLTGKGTAPFAVQYQRDGLGLSTPHAICVGRGIHYFMSPQGPAALAAGELKLLAPESRQYLLRLGLLDGCVFAAWDEARSRVYFVGKEGLRYPGAVSPPTAGSFAGIGASTMPYGQLRLVAGIERGGVWVEDGVSWVGAGVVSGESFALRADGLFVAFPLLPIVGTDARTTAANVAVVVESAADSAWVDFGTLEQKQISKVIVSLRSVSEVSGLWTSSANTLQLGALEIFTDDDQTTAAFSGDLFVLVSQMQSYAKDAGVLPAVMRFALTPRVAGQAFRFCLHNRLTATAIAAGRKQGHFRLSGLEVFYDQQESRRPLRPTNAA